MYIKEEGDRYLIALDEDGKTFDALVDVISISKNEIDKVVFFDGSSLDIASINLYNSVNDEILEGDGLETIYEGSLSEDNSTALHQFSISTNSVNVNSGKVTGLSITLLDAATGAYQVNGNFDGLADGENVEVRFRYEVNYDSEDLALISGEKEMSLTVTGTADIPDVVEGEIIYGGSGDDYLVGGLGDDRIYDYYGGNDTLVGGEGNDYLAGGSGIDTYIYHRGDGQDIIYDEFVELGRYEEVSPQIIHFYNGISSGDLSYLRDGDDMILLIANLNGVTDFQDQIRIKDYYTIGNPYQLRLGEGEYSTISFAEVPLFVDSWIVGTPGDDTLDGAAGDSNDLLYGNTGNEI